MQLRKTDNRVRHGIERIGGGSVQDGLGVDKACVFPHGLRRHDGDCQGDKQE